MCRLVQLRGSACLVPSVAYVHLLAALPSVSFPFFPPPFLSFSRPSSTSSKNARLQTKGFEVVSEAEERALSQALKASLNTVPDAATPFPFDAARPQSFGHAGGSSSGGGKFKSSSSGGSKAKSHKAKAKGGGASVAKSHKRASSASSNNADSPLQQAIRASLVEAQLAAEERAAALSEGAGPSSSSRDRKGKGPAGHHQQQEQQPGYTSTSTSTSSTNNQPPNSTSAASPPLPKSNFPTHESGNVIVRPKGFREFGEASTLVGTFKCTAAEVVTFFSDGSNDPYRYLQAEKVLGMQAPTPEMVAEAAAEKRKAATPSSRSATPSSHHGGGGGGAKSPNQRKPSSSSGGGGGEAAEGASAGERKEKRRRTSKTQAFDLTDAPVYRPSATEFSEPLDYIASIRDEAQKYGICRIIPPKQWQPSFQLDPTNFKFNTRKSVTSLRHLDMHPPTAANVFLRVLCCGLSADSRHQPLTRACPETIVSAGFNIHSTACYAQYR